MKIIELDISKNSKSSFSEETCTNEEIMDLNLDDLDSFHFLGDTEVIDVSEDVEACSFSKTDDFYSRRDGWHPEDAFDIKLSDLEFISDKDHFIKKNFEYELSMKQIEALTHFGANGIKEDCIKYFSDNFRKEQWNNELQKSHSGDTKYLSDIPKEILDDFTDRPKYSKSEYKIPLSAKWKIFKLRLKGGKLYSYKSTKKQFKKTPHFLKKNTISALFNLWKINWMLFVCSWHNYRLNNQRGAQTHYLTESLELTKPKLNYAQKAITYQDLFPVKENKLAVWFVNLKPVKDLETKLHAKYSKKIQDYVLDYVKNDLVFSQFESDLVNYEPKKKKHKRVNKKGKPYRVARIG